MPSSPRGGLQHSAQHFFHYLHFIFPPPCLAPASHPLRVGVECTVSGGALTTDGRMKVRPKHSRILLYSFVASIVRSYSFISPQFLRKVSHLTFGLFLLRSFQVAVSAAALQGSSSSAGVTVVVSHHRHLRHSVTASHSAVT